MTKDYESLLAALFATSPGVNRCWCMWPLRPRGTHCPDEGGNRAAMLKLLRSGESPGLIALAAGRALGWCAVGPRQRYLQYESAADVPITWALPCIYIHPSADQRVVARALIDAAVRLAIANHAAALDGPPPWWLPGDDAATASAAELFLENGFVQIGAGARMPELRRRLA